jgi:DNA-binding CsgD family transcriptional regulator
VPMWLLGTVFGALADTAGHGDGTARSRARTRRGTWLVGHGSCLHDADSSLRAIAVVIEPATAAAIAPIIVQAYDLTDREEQITRLIARGASTSDIAGELFLSTHTVHDHVKAIFAKVGVTSRGEQDAGRPTPPEDPSATTAGDRPVPRPVPAATPPGKDVGHQGQHQHRGHGQAQGDHHHANRFHETSPPTTGHIGYPTNRRSIRTSWFRPGHGG